MPSLGSVGTNFNPVPTFGYLTGSPLWWSPVRTDVGMRNDSIRGPEPATGAFTNGRVPVLLITPTVAQYGQSGGGISIF